MLINPNLTKRSEFNKNNILIYNNSMDVVFIDENTIKIKKKDGVEYGLIFVNLFADLEIGAKIAFSGKFELIKGKEVIVFLNAMGSEKILISKTGVNKIENIGVQTKGTNQAQVRLFKDDEVVFRFTEMKVEKDEVTPYIPNENTIEPSKQAVFVAGGIPRGVSTLSLKLVDFDQLCMGVGYVS